VQTFVDVGPLFSLLSGVDHQILFGRRGTGKTHALKFLADEVRRLDGVAVYVDLRTIGSTGGIYADPSVSIAERGTRLLLDTMTVIHDALVAHALQRAVDDDVDTSEALTLLDQLAEQIGNAVRVVGTVDTTDTAADTATSDASGSVGVTISPAPALSLQLSRGGRRDARRERSVSRHGVEVHRVHFGAVTRLVADLIDELGINRLWILVDEWSSIPLDLQPLLADLLRRSLFPIPQVTVKIGAVEQRSDFRVALPTGELLGLEIGADASADVDLDDFMVFGNDAECAKEFFRRLLYKHVAAVLDADGLAYETPESVMQFVRQAFTQEVAFDEFVKASEGVPRDAIHIVAMAAAKANDVPISVTHVRSAARSWYQRDKESALADDARDLLQWIVSEVLGQRQARAFMLREGEDRRHPVILTLYDARVLHLIRRNLVAHDEPGTRYHCWGLDYGCYVDLISTARAPKGVFQVELDAGTEAYVDVPSDDYRSIRRAILDLDAFERRRRRRSASL
jgi:hypothetical protein